MIDHQAKIEIRIPIENGEQYQTLMAQLDNLLYTTNNQFDYMVKAQLDTFIVDLPEEDDLGPTEDEGTEPSARTLLPTNGRDHGLPGVPPTGDEQAPASA